VDYLIAHITRKLSVSVSSELCNKLLNDTLRLSGMPARQANSESLDEGVSIFLNEAKIDSQQIFSSRSLDLGCGAFPKNPFSAEHVIGIDIHSNNNSAVVSVDLASSPIPFEDSSFGYVTAFDFIEHVPRFVSDPIGPRFPFVQVMNEIYRVLDIGGLFLSITPAYPHAQAFQDPTHINIITWDTFPAYFTDLYGKPWADIYGFRGCFALVAQQWSDFHLLTLLRKQ